MEWWQVAALCVLAYGAGVATPRMVRRSRWTPPRWRG